MSQLWVLDELGFALCGLASCKDPQRKLVTRRGAGSNYCNISLRVGFCFHRDFCGTLLSESLEPTIDETPTRFINVKDEAWWELIHHRVHLGKECCYSLVIWRCASLDMGHTKGEAMSLQETVDQGPTNGDCQAVFLAPSFNNPLQIRTRTSSLFSDYLCPQVLRNLALNIRRYLSSIMFVGSWWNRRRVSQLA